ncbi:MAG: hypothetical protein ACRD0Z_01305 [Acidimicrobiales bacterium]
MRRRLLGAVEDNLLYTPPQPVDDELMDEIRRHARTEVEKLSEYTGRDLLSLWKYE